MICTICARGGSKGVPGKNKRLLQGRPLISWTIDQARKTSLFEIIAVSSDDEEILSVAGEAGADMLIRRPAELASDGAGKIPAIAHALATAEEHLGRKADRLVDLDVTSPLRSVDDIIDCVTLAENTRAGSVITGAEARRSPYFNLVELDAEGMVRLSKGKPGTVLRRQDAPRCYDMNASIYVWDRDRFVADPQVFYPDTRLFEMPAERSVDIDSELDFLIVDLLMQRAFEQEGAA